MGHLRFGLIHFSLADVFYLGGHLRLESFCIQVNIVHSMMCKSAILHCKISNMGKINFFFTAFKKWLVFYSFKNIY